MPLLHLLRILLTFNGSVLRKYLHQAKRLCGTIYDIYLILAENRLRKVMSRYYQVTYGLTGQFRNIKYGFAVMALNSYAFGAKMQLNRYD